MLKTPSLRSAAVVARTVSRILWSSGFAMADTSSPLRGTRSESSTADHACRGAHRPLYPLRPDLPEEGLGTRAYVCIACNPILWK
jgi:hypothetical protein